MNFVYSKTAVLRSRRASRVVVLVALLGVIGAAPTAAYSQAEPTAIRSGDLQVGGTFSQGNSDYNANAFRGFGFYTTFDFRYHLGVEGAFHQVNDSNSSSGVYERTYELGPRYVFHYRRLRPWVRAMYGRGVFNFPPIGNSSTGQLRANLAFNLVSAGVGADYRLKRSITLRADYEYQDWLQFLPHGLTPAIVELGAAYHFH